jgi:mannosyltransferase
MTQRARFVLALIMKRWWIVVAIGMLTSFVLILFLGKDQQLWFDESYSILLARQPVGTLLSLTSVDAHPPIFYLLLKAWGSTFGWSELALRSMSALIAALTVGAMTLLLRKLFRTSVALVCLPFFIIAPFWLRYGYEIRMYALASLIGVVASLVLLRAVELKQDKRWWVAYGLLVVLGMYTLYVTIAVWLSHAVWLMLRDRRKFWRQPWFVTYVAAVVLFLPYLPTAIFQSTHSALPGVGDELNLTGMGNVLSMILAYTPQWDVNTWIAAGISIIVGLTIYLLVKVYSRADVKQKISLNYIFCLAFIPALLFFLVSVPLPQPFFVTRYLAHVILFIYALVASAVALGWQYGFKKTAALLGVIAAAILVTGMVHLSIVGNYNFDRLESQQAETTRDLVDCKDTLVVADDPYTYINDSYYFYTCTMRVYSTIPIPYKGGYAWMYNHGGRISSASQIDAPRIAVISMNNLQQQLKPDGRYRLVSTVSDNQQRVATYELIGQ